MPSKKRAALSLRRVESACEALTPSSNNVNMNRMRSSLSLLDADERQLKSLLIEDLRCTIDWRTAAIGDDFADFGYEKWIQTLNQFLPCSGDTTALRDEYGSPLSEPDEDSFLLEDIDELRSLACNTRQFRESYRAAYEKACGPIRDLRALDRSEYPKHYLPNNKFSSEEVARYSSINPSVGILMPYLDVDTQATLLGTALGDILLKSLNGNFRDDEKFAVAWGEVFESRQMRYSLSCLEVTGFYDGEPCEWLIFDVSYDLSRFHCYPALGPIPDTLKAICDELQGAKNRFDENLRGLSSQS